MERATLTPTNRPPSRASRFGAGACALTLVALLTACGGAARASGDNQVPTLTGQRATASAPADQLQPYREVVQCLRQHGLPNMPDPVLDEQGRPTFTEEMAQVKENPALQQACAEPISRLPARQSGREARAVTADEMARQRQFVECLRQNGLPELPDPDAVSGLIELPPNLDKDVPAMRQALQACESRAVPGLGFTRAESR
jgi:hypothetical protein